MSIQKRSVPLSGTIISYFNGWLLDYTKLYKSIYIKTENGSA